MAVKSNTGKIAAALGKRLFVAQISSSSSCSTTTAAYPPLSAAALVSRHQHGRSLHGSVYDKNVDDHVAPAVVPDDIIEPQSDKYWAPNPQTGVFGPAAEHNPSAGGPERERGFHTWAGGEGGSESVLEQKAFFRPQEDLEKPESA